MTYAGNLRAAMRRCIFLMVSWALLQSCSVYHFYSPQPLNRPGLYTFPAAMRGVWVAEIGSPGEMIEIREKYALYTWTETGSVVRGAWPKLDKEGALRYLPGPFLPLCTVHYDSSGMPRDTVSNFIFRDQLIFEVLDDGRLGNGYPYRNRGDTVEILKSDSLVIDMGRNAFLRRLGENTYAFNIRETIFGEKEGWWQVLLIEGTSDTTMNICTGNPKLAQQPGMFFETVRGWAEQYYFKLGWSAKDMLMLLKAGGFEITSSLVKKTAPQNAET